MVKSCTLIRLIGVVMIQYSQVCTELENNCGMNDPTLAEFIIDLASKNKNELGFSQALEGFGADFPVGVDMIFSPH